jgi:hypothetical protein
MLHGVPSIKKEHMIIKETLIKEVLTKENFAQWLTEQPETRTFGSNGCNCPIFDFLTSKIENICWVTKEDVGFTNSYGKDVHLPQWAIDFIAKWDGWYLGVKNNVRALDILFVI